MLWPTAADAAGAGTALTIRTRATAAWEPQARLHRAPRPWPDNSGRSPAQRPGSMEVYAPHPTDAGPLRGHAE
eukprot:COSAG04_NODE_24345_length_323_cov_0.866071_1_plen_72_part_10